MSGISSVRSGGLVIVGGSLAGLAAAQCARDAGWEGELTVVDEEAGAYARPPLSKGLLAGSESEQSIALPDPDGVTYRRGVSAVLHDLDRRRIILDDGDQLSYDALIVASGGRARRLGVPGEHTLRTLTDARRLQKRLAPGTELVIVGGGLLAMEVAATTTALGVRVTLIARRPPLRDALGTFLADAVVETARERGVRIIVDPGLIVEGHDSETLVRTGDTIVTGDVFVSAIGDIPRTEWVGERAVRTDGAIPVDHGLRASARIWGAGDAVAQAGRARTPHWDAALRQGGIAARNAVRWLHGEETVEPFEHDRYLWTEVFGLHLKVAGVTPGAADPTIIAGDWATRAALLHWPGDPIGSAVSVNHRMPVARLRAMARAAPPAAESALIPSPSPTAHHRR